LLGEELEEQMKRERRYVVLKIADLQGLTPLQMEQLDEICDAVAEFRVLRGKPRLECVCVESDWPEYEPVWGMIAARMDGTPNKQYGRT
jgi:hypothetical protein